MIDVPVGHILEPIIPVRVQIASLESENARCLFGNLVDAMEEAYGLRPDPEDVVQEAESLHVRTKCEKADRVEAYRLFETLSPEEIGEVPYIVDEDRLYRNQMAFVNSALRAGILEKDDFIED